MHPGRLSEFILAAVRPYRDCFVFGGRATRSEALLFNLFTAPILSLIGAVLLRRNGFEPPSLLSGAWTILAWLPVVSLTARRLHDQGRSEGWALLYWGAAVLAVATAASLPQTGGTASLTFFGWRFTPAPGPLATLVSAGTILLVAAGLAIDLAPGQAGTNRYGTDPRL